MKSMLYQVMLPTMAAAALFAAAPVSAKLNADEIKALGTTLTPMGAEREGNKDGSIPPYSGKWLGVPPGVSFSGTGKHQPDPYANEKPLYTITAQNMAQYADRLSEGQKALFKKFPDSFRMPVYPSHRDFRYPDKVHANVKENAAQAEVIEGGNGIQGAFGGPAFPIPKSGIELIWNMLSSAKATSEIAIYDQAVVYPDGNIAWGRVDYKILATVNDVNASRKAWDGKSDHFNVLTLLPEREKGTIIIGHGYWDFVNHPRQAWQYNPGTRRVRQLPSFGFDMPQGPGGFRTVDDDRLFNGSPERYDWKIIGKKEIYIPYNAYKINDPKIKYADMLSKGHINPEVMRYELHRVWVLEAKLKPGVRHQYAKRVFYTDEDTWNAIMVDNYDARGELWRVGMINFYYAYELQGYQAGVALFHDLLSGAYMADRMINEQKNAPRINSGELDTSQFTPDAARQKGL
ncbi:DUF1329 domain-containing protein [Herbaspirillum sp. GCM10030257]|uniref:DUF1329 domain-containing protein n=1 Tax=Herbaspirillum sp. GCM10030257 TaxID=3273393 RepID=UPI00361FB6AF